jgi:hypothetical protein
LVAEGEQPFTMNRDIPAALIVLIPALPYALSFVLSIYGRRGKFGD